MKSKAKRHVLPAFRMAVIILCVAALAVFLLSDLDISVESLLDHSPENPVAVAGLFLVLYAFKSATLFIPIIVLEIAVGLLFPTWAALLVNFLGTLIALAVPYWIGRAAGTEAINKIINKYPKLGEILDRQQDSTAFLCFFLRIISCLPGDVVTMYLGATRVPFRKNLVFGALGISPGMILATLVGQSIQDPSSPMFWISAVLMVLMSGASILVYYLYRRRLQKEGDGV